MAIKKLRARNFLSLRDVEVELSKVNILVGLTRAARAMWSECYSYCKAHLQGRHRCLNGYIYESLYLAYDVTKDVVVGANIAT